MWLFAFSRHSIRAVNHDLPPSSSVQSMLKQRAAVPEYQVIVKAEFGLMRGEVMHKKQALCSVVYGF